MMKRLSYRVLRRLLCSGLILVMALSHLAVVYAAEAGFEEENRENSAVTETNGEEEPLAQEVASSDTAEPEALDSASSETSEPMAEETLEPEQEEPLESVSEEAEEPAPETSEQYDEDIVSVMAAESTAAGTVHIGDTTFGLEEDESSHWSDGKGWKNLAGQYVALVDYDGAGTEISMDEGTLNLAVAGINRIGALKGDCSVNIVGTGIVLIDNIELKEGNTLSLMPDISLYETGSAAVFLKQEDGSYLLINGGITGILDEQYTLDNVRLVIPEGSSLTLGAIGVRTETWYPEDADGPVTDVTLYTKSFPDNANVPSHENGEIRLEGATAQFILGKNSTLIVDNGAFISLEEITKQALIGIETIAANLVIQGVLNIKGLVKGGIIDVSAGGSLLGAENGTVRSSQVNLDSAGNLSKDLLLEDCSVTVKGNRSVSAKIKDSVMYLKGSVYVEDLEVFGTSMLSMETGSFHAYSCGIGNVTFNSGGCLEILSNEHSYWGDGDLLSKPSRLLEDCILDIYGRITGGTVSVLAGGVRYSGKRTDTVPIVPDGYASRVIVSSLDTDSSVYPLIMTQKEANERVNSNRIPVMRLTVKDTLYSDQVRSRIWVVKAREELDPLERKKDQRFTCASFLEAYDLDPYDGDYYTAVEVIYSDFWRERFWIDDPNSFSTDNVILIRVIDATGSGGQGGATISHTETSYTGSGVLGGTGAGSVTSGKGTVVYPPYNDPYHTDPIPVDPDPTDPDQNKNENANNNESSHNENINNNENKDSSTTEEKKETKPIEKVVAEYTKQGLTLTVSVLEAENEEIDGEKKNEPRIYKLSVTEEGVPVKDLAGSAVKVIFPFTVPSAWGDPKEIAEDSLYAVFADEKEEPGKEGLTAYKAKYDFETGEVSFDTKQTGKFVIVMYTGKEKPFTKEFYRELAEMKDIKVFLEDLT